MIILFIRCYSDNVDRRKLRVPCYQRRNFTKFFVGVGKVALRTFIVCDVFFLTNSSSPMALGPVSYPAKWQISQCCWGEGEAPPYPP